jgi:hypothetical protein
MFSRLRMRLSQNYHEAYERDRRWMMQFDIATLEKFVWPLLVGFICLNFLDVYTTTLGLTFGQAFHEQNPLASILFDRQFQGYLIAIAFKYLPLIPLFYLAFVRDRTGEHAMQIRMLKFSAVIALAGADIYLFYVVGIHNLQSLLSLR